MIVWEKHRTKVKNVLVVHFIAETDADSRSRLAGVVAATRFWAELHNAINDMMRSHIASKNYSLTKNQESSVAR